MTTITLNLAIGADHLRMVIITTITTTITITLATIITITIDIPLTFATILLLLLLVVVLLREAGRRGACLISSRVSEIQTCVELSDLALGEQPKKIETLELMLVL